MGNKYERFVGEFGEALGRSHGDACFYVYGSFCRGDYSPKGNSDIDGGIILDSEALTPKDKIDDISKILAFCLARNRVPLQINLTDRQTNRDGRFLSYTTDYTDHIKREHRICSGPDFVTEMNGINYKSGVLNNAAHNLRKARNWILYSQDNFTSDTTLFKENLLEILSLAVKFPKKLIWLQGRDEIVTDFREARELIMSFFPNFDATRLKDFGSLRHQPLDSVLLNDAIACFELYRDGVEMIECLINLYITKFPQLSQREAKG